MLILLTFKKQILYKIIYKTSFYGLATEQEPKLELNRNRNLSKVETGTGTGTAIITKVPQHYFAGKIPTLSRTIVCLTVLNNPQNRQSTFSVHPSSLYSLAVPSFV
jgi:hypothetical protein